MSLALERLRVLCPARSGRATLLLLRKAQPNRRMQPTCGGSVFDNGNSSPAID